MGSEVIKDLRASVTIRTLDGKVFSSKLKVLSLLSTSKLKGIGTVNVLILFDEQLKCQGDSKQDKIFDFKVCLFSNKTFR